MKKKIPRNILLDIKESILEKKGDDTFEVFFDKYIPEEEQTSYWSLKSTYLRLGLEKTKKIRAQQLKLLSYMSSIDDVYPAIEWLHDNDCLEGDEESLRWANAVLSEEIHSDRIRDKQVKKRQREIRRNYWLERAMAIDMQEAEMEEE